MSDPVEVLEPDNHKQAENSAGYEVAGFVPRGPYVVQTITREEFHEILRCKQQCATALICEERFKLVIDNFWEWEVELLKHAQSKLLWGDQGHDDAMNQRLDLDRRLANLLSSFRLYIDQSARSITNLLGKSASQSGSLNQFKRDLYDSNLNYRPIEALRNHVQHCGLPVHSIHYNYCREEAEEGVYLRHTVKPMLSLAEIALNVEFKASVLREMKGLEPGVDLRVPVRDYVSCLTSLHDKTRELIADLVRAARATYVAVVEKYSVIKGKSVEFAWLWQRDSNGETFEKCDLVAEFLGLCDRLHQRNSGVRHLRWSYASGATHNSRR